MNSPMTLPETLMADFESGCVGRADVDMSEVLHAIIGDVIDTAVLAVRELQADADDLPTEVRNVVEDYVANHYGEA
jgi:hypothetical protein